MSPSAKKKYTTAYSIISLKSQKMVCIKSSIHCQAYVTVRAIVNLKKIKKKISNYFSCSRGCHWQRKKCISFLFQVPRQVRICYFITARSEGLFLFVCLVWLYTLSFIEESQHLSNPPMVAFFMCCKQSWGPRSWQYGPGPSLTLSPRQTWTFLGWWYETG